MSESPYPPNISCPEELTRRRVTGSRHTLSLLPIRGLYVWAGARALHHLPEGLLTPTLFPDLGPRRDKRVYNRTSFICLISLLHRIMITADPPPSAPCYHIKYRIKQQGSHYHLLQTQHTSDGLKCHDLWESDVC